MPYSFKCGSKQGGHESDKIGFEYELRITNHYHFLEFEFIMNPLR